MLQINTGKLYTRGVGRTNQLTGVVYSNARLPFQRAADTRAGTMRQTGWGPSDLAIVYELEERIEAEDSTVSHTVDPFLNDFAVVASFAFGAVFSRDLDIFRALTAGEPGFSSYTAPDKLVARFFDRTIYVQDEEVNDFRSFVSDLLALKRKSYLGVMRAMRTFIAGLHRIPDDLALAYTLIVSAVESLAQDFDAFEPAWSDLQHGKRKRVDAALTEVADNTADAVRSAILATEHVALARRYRDFVVARVKAGYFRQTDVAGSHPVARYELAGALRQAYEVRSAYIHRLQPLPSVLRLPSAYRETTTLERRPALTFQGLYRLTRHVIRDFIVTGEKVEHEPYKEYKREQAGAVSLPLPPQYWIWKNITERYGALNRLEGLLGLIASVLRRDPDAQLVDIRPMLDNVERMLPQAGLKDRPALLSLYFLFNLFVHPDLRTAGFADFAERHNEEASKPSIESLAAGTLLGATESWTIDDHRAVLDNYLAQRVLCEGLHAPRLVEAAMCLDLAEKYRAAGRIADAQEMLALATECHPGHTRLIYLESSFDGTARVSWRDILLAEDTTSGIQA